MTEIKIVCISNNDFVTERMSELHSCNKKSAKYLLSYEYLFSNGIAKREPCFFVMKPFHLQVF